MSKSKKISDFPPIDTLDPGSFVVRWLQEAQQANPQGDLPVALATCDLRNHPSVRMVLLKFFDAQECYFFTNLLSQKGKNIAECPQVSFVSYHEQNQRQLRITGRVECLPRNMTTEYFSKRPRQSQVASLISKQSSPLLDWQTFYNQVYQFLETFSDQPIPCPEHWSGFRIIYESMEFWENEAFRLHKRIIFKQNSDQSWYGTFLYP